MTAPAESKKAIQRPVIIISFLILYAAVSLPVIFNPSLEWTSSIIRFAALFTAMLAISFLVLVYKRYIAWKRRR